VSPRPDIPSFAPAPGGPPAQARRRRIAPARPPSSPAARSAPSLSALAARSAPPLAAGALLVLLAAFQADRASAAETAYLALWITAVLLPAAALATAPAWESTLGAPLAVLAAWALPAGAARSAVIGALLVTVFALAAARALGSRPRDRHGARDHLALTLPLALGAQALLRGELLLAPGPAEVAALVALPAIGAGGLALLAARCGRPAALLAGAAAVTLGPGWTAVTALALAGAALGAEVRTVRRRRPGAAASPFAVAALGLLLAVGLATETRAAAAALAAAAVIAYPRSHRRAALLGLLLAAALPGTASLAPLRTGAESLALLAWVPALLPALAWAPALPRSRWVPLIAALGVAAAGAIAVPGIAAPAAGLAALAVLLTGDPQGRIPAAEAVQTAWSAALLAGTALLASYPWLRAAPAADALALVGLSPGWRTAAVLSALALAIGLGARAAARVPGLPRLAAWAAAVAIGAALFAALPPPARPAFAGSAALGPQRPLLAVELDGSPVAVVDVFSNLSGAAELAAGTEVASARLLGAGGEIVVRWTLRAGEGTGEWAARRPDVAALPTLAAPPAWTSWVEAGGAEGAAGEPFFGQLYRARWKVRPPVPAARLVIERNPALPPGVALSVRRVEVVP